MSDEVLWFTLAVTMATGLLFGVAPAVSASRADPHEVLKAGRSLGLRTSRAHPRRTLVVLELALAVVLTVGAALLVKSFIKFQAVDRGFEGERVLIASVSLPRTRYTNEPARRAFFDSVLARLQALPTVESASVSQVGLSGMSMTMGWPPGANAGDRRTIAILSNVGSGHFRTFGIPVQAGRDCGTGERSPEAVINSRMAQLAFRGSPAVGQQLDLRNQGSFTVVGVSADVKNLGTNALPLPTVYACAARTEAPASGVIAVRPRPGADPMSLTPVLRQAVFAADPDQPISNVMTVKEMVGRAVTTRWFDAALVTAFAGVALVLAVLGLYSIIAYLVAERTQEIGIRMALGATRTDVLRLVLTQGSLLTVAGIGLGLCAAVPLVRLVASMLFEVEVLDLSVFGVMAVLLTFISMAAAVIPALRATRVDPLVALRTE